MVKRLLTCILITGLFSACTEPYIPEIKNAGDKKILIVEGYINASGNTTYSLGYIAPLFQEADSSAMQVQQAELAIEEENGRTFTGAVRVDNHRFIIDHPPLDPAGRYRLRIKADGKEYLSAFVPVMISPEIQNVTWEMNSSEGVRFFLDTESSKETYFRWEFEEAWRFRVPNMSLFLYDWSQFSVRERSPEEYYPLFCYLTEQSSGIHLYTTESMSENKITQLPLHFIPLFSEKLGMRYSIRVQQYAMSKEAFAYWSLVKKNSEEIGDIFGTMPTDLPTNITCISHPGEKAVGLIEAGQPAEKVVFVDYGDLPVPWVYKYVYYGRCVITPDNMVPKEQAEWFFAQHPEFEPVDETSPNDPSNLTHYSYASKTCLDCSYRGSKSPPPYWNN